MKLGDKPWFCTCWGRVVWLFWQLCSAVLCLVTLRFFLEHNPIFYFCITISLLQLILCCTWSMLLSAAQTWKPSWMRRIERIFRSLLLGWATICTVLNLVILLYWHWNTQYDPDRNLLIISIFTTLLHAPLVGHYLLYPQPLVTVKFGHLSRGQSQSHFYGPPGVDEGQGTNATSLTEDTPSDPLAIVELVEESEESQTGGIDGRSSGQIATEPEDIEEVGSQAQVQATPQSSGVSIAIQAEIQLPIVEVHPTPTAPPESPPESPPPPPAPLETTRLTRPSPGSARSSQTSINRPSFPPPPPPLQSTTQASSSSSGEERPTAVVHPTSPLPFGASRPGQCTVCMDRPVDRITDCNHRFCWLCVEHLRSTDLTFKCPVCRNRIKNVRELRLRIGEAVEDWPRSIYYSYH